MAEPRKLDFGPSVKPTGKLRLLTSPSTGRLQMEWAGEFGSGFFDVPIVEVPELPPRNEGEG